MGALWAPMAGSATTSRPLTEAPAMSEDVTWAFLMAAVGVFGAMTWWFDRLEGRPHLVRLSAAAGIISMLVLLYWTWKP